MTEQIKTETVDSVEKPPKARVGDAVVVQLLGLLNPVVGDHEQLLLSEPCKVVDSPF